MRMKIIYVFMAVGMMIGMGVEAEEIIKAQAVLNPTQGNEAHGVIQFIQEPEGVRILGDIEGLTPGKHGFHIHETGDCSAPDATSAGGHFNPHQMSHGSPTDATRHTGDFGNVIADETGKAHVDYVDTQAALSGENSIIARGVIVHAQEDDLKTQPTGNAGARVACGVVEVVKE